MEKRYRFVRSARFLRVSHPIAYLQEAFRAKTPSLWPFDLFIASIIHSNCLSPVLAGHRVDLDAAKLY